MIKYLSNRYYWSKHETLPRRWFNSIVQHRDTSNKVVFQTNTVEWFWLTGKHNVYTKRRVVVSERGIWRVKHSSSMIKRDIKYITTYASIISTSYQHHKFFRCLHYLICSCLEMRRLKEIIHFKSLPYPSIPTLISLLFSGYRWSLSSIQKEKKILPIYNVFC